MIAAALLSPLREDLKLFPAAAGRDGSPAWVIQDPVGNRFFRIGWLEFEVLNHWGLRDPTLVADAVGEQTGLAVSADDVTDIGDFFRRSQLLRVTDARGVAWLSKTYENSRPGLLKWLLHNYLFVRIPLVHPQAFLQWLGPKCGLFYTWGFVVTTALATMLGLVLAARQWGVFAGTFTNFFSLDGLLWFALALAFTKTLHELGHAVTATRLGVRVAHMGLAFLVMWPMLYTDTGESWKLARRSDRFRIAAAGMAIEIALAGFATLAWSLSEAGALRNALFFLATTSWLVTLGINASPFMRFDGYFLLSDALDMPNLHQRSFAFAQTSLRRGLFGWNEPEPEIVSRRMRRFLVAFAWVTWTYRFILFIGIALLVYHFFFKVLGIFLFVVEITWFIARPVWGEVSVWMKRRNETGSARTAMLAVVIVATMAVLLAPWQRSVSGPGWLHAEQSQQLFSPFAARLIEIAPAGPVKAGAVLAQLDSPDTRGLAGQIEAATASLEIELARSVGRSDGAVQRNLIIGKLARETAALDSQREELSRLRLEAAFDGVLVDRDPRLAPGAWVSARQPLATLIDPTHWVIDALIDQREVERVAVGAKVSFYRRNDAGAPMRGEVVQVDPVRIQKLPDPVFDAQGGGPVATVRLDGERVVPREPLYRVRIAVPAPDSNVGDPSAAATSTTAPMMLQTALGNVRIEAEGRSPLMAWLRNAAAVLVRESGF